MMEAKKGIVCVLAFVCCICEGQAIGAERMKVRALGGFSKQIQSSLIEVPFYKQLQEEVGDRLNIQFRTMDELGQKGFQTLRQLKAGVFDIIEIQLGYISGDDPYWQGLDLIGVAPDIETARAVMEAYREVLDKRLQEKFNGKILCLWPYGTQVFYFRERINGLKDFKGKKIRVFSRPMADFVKYFGATGITLPFPEVYPAMQRGVIDGAITGVLSGNTASWFEVAKYLYLLPMGFALQAHAASLGFWKKLDPEMRDFLTEKFRELEDDFWRYASEATQDGINCNTGQSPCKYGQTGDMVLIKASPEDGVLMKQAAQDVVLTEWAKGCDRIDPNCSEVWNKTAGKVVGMKIMLH